MSSTKKQDTAASRSAKGQGAKPATGPATAVAHDDDRSIEQVMIARGSTGIAALPMLDVIFNRLPTDVISAFKTRAGLLAEGGLEKIYYGPWGKVLTEFDAYSVFTIANARQWAGNIIIAMDPVFFYSAIETQLNGTPSAESIPRRHPSTIERRLARSISETLLEEVGANFARLTEVDFTIEGIENAQQIASQLGENAPCVMSVMEISIGQCVGKISIIIPLATVEPVQAKLKKMFLGEKLGGDGSWRDHISSRISSSTVTVEAQLAEVSVPLQQILQWKPGSTFEIGVEEASEVTLFCSKMPVLHGVAGRRRNDRAAIRITRDYGEEIAMEGQYE